MAASIHNKTHQTNLTTTKKKKKILPLFDFGSHHFYLRSIDFVWDVAFFFLIQISPLFLLSFLQHWENPNQKVHLNKWQSHKGGEGNGLHRGWGRCWLLSAGAGWRDTREVTEILAGLTSRSFLILKKNSSVFLPLKRESKCQCDATARKIYVRTVHSATKEERLLLLTCPVVCNNTCETVWENNVLFCLVFYPHILFRVVGHCIRAMSFGVPCVCDAAMSDSNNLTPT